MPNPGTQIALHSCHRFLEQWDPYSWFLEFCREKKISKKDRCWHEMKTLVTAVKQAGEYDQWNLGSSAALETILRRIASIATAYKDGDIPNWALAQHMGQDADIHDLVPEGFRSEESKKAREQLEIEALRKRIGDARGGSDAVHKDAEKYLDAGGLPPTNSSAAAKGRGTRGRGPRAKAATGPG